MIIKDIDDKNRNLRLLVEEQMYNGKKYIRFIGNSNSNGEILSNGEFVEIDKPYWILVEPIKWLVDEINDIALSKKIIFSGVQFNRESN